MKTASQITVRAAIQSDEYCGSGKPESCYSDAGEGSSTLEEYRAELKAIIARFEVSNDEGLTWPGPNGCTMATGRAIASLANGELDTLEGAEDRYNEAWDNAAATGADEESCKDEAESAIYNF